jgi:hypothetical protein
LKNRLSHYDRTEVIAATRMLRGTWFAEFHESPNGKSYACLGQSERHGRFPAFLLKWRDGFVVLTDRLSDETQDQVTRHQNMTKATRVVFAMVLASIRVIGPE